MPLGMTKFTRKDIPMKKIRTVAALLLALSLLLSVVSCGDKGYAPVKSSDEELALTLSFDDAYDVTYEMYRFYFLSELSLSGEDPAAMGEAKRQAFFEEITQKALEEVAYLAAVESLCKTYGIDIESDEIDEAVQTDVNELVDETYGGDHEKYLAALKAGNMTDSVLRRVLRMKYAEKALGDHVRDTGVIKSDVTTVQRYMRSDECIRVSWIYLSYDSVKNYNQTQLDTIAQEAKLADNEQFMRMTHNVIPDTYTDEELEIGFYIGRYQLDPYYEELTEAAFSLALGETTDWVRSGDGMYIVRRFQKDEEYLGTMGNLGDFTEYYLLNEFYGMLAAEQTRLLASVRYDASFHTLSFDSIKMPK